MIRDPSDGSVREKSENEIRDSAADSHRLLHDRHANEALVAISKVHETLENQGKKIASGLPLESTKAAGQFRLEASRAWLKSYFKRNPEQGT